MKVKSNRQKENYLQKHERNKSSQKKNLKKSWSIVLTELGIWGLLGLCLVFYLHCRIEACDGILGLDPYNKCLEIEEPEPKSDQPEPKSDQPEPKSDQPEPKSDPVCTRSGDSANIDNPLKLCSYADLELVRADLNGHYVLGQDVDMLEGSDTPGSAEGDTEFWKPIGDDLNPFRGTFDGGAYVISNLRIVEFSQPAGFFGRVAGAQARISNVFLENVNVRGRDYVGALVAYNQGAAIQNSYAAGSVNGNRIGVLVGQMEGGSIENSYAQGTLQGGSSAGGLLGYNDGGEVRSCYALVEIRATHSAGGLLGYSKNGALVENSYASANIRTSGVNIGGLVGYNSAAIRNSYAVGEINSNSNFSWKQGTGGLVGHNENGTIENSYSSSSVSFSASGSEAYAGGLVGLNEGEVRGVNYFASSNESDGGSDGVGNGTACDGCSQMDALAIRDSLNESDPSALAWTMSPLPWTRLGEAGYPCLESIVFGRGGCIELDP